MPLLVGHYATYRFAFVHQIKGIIDTFQRHSMRDQIVDIDTTLHIPIDYFRNISPALRATKGSTFPGTPGHELERSCGDFFTRAGDSDNHGGTPTALTTFQSLPH